MKRWILLLNSGQPEAEWMESDHWSISIVNSSGLQFVQAWELGRNRKRKICRESVRELRPLWSSLDPHATCWEPFKPHFLLWDWTRSKGGVRWGPVVGVMCLEADHHGKRMKHEENVMLIWPRGPSRKCSLYSRWTRIAYACKSPAPKLLYAL